MVRTLVDVSVTHEFFLDGICPQLSIRPDEESSRELSARRLAVRSFPGGFRIHAFEDSILDVPVRCRAEGWCRDPLFDLYTDLPQPPGGRLTYQEGRLHPDRASLIPEPGDPQKAGSAPSPKLEIGFSVSDSTTPKTFRIGLAARRMRWKFHLFGEYSRPEVEISGTDPSGNAIAFQPSLASALRDATSWVTEHPIAARQRAEHRIQLRDTGTGRILVKRLPNPDLRTFGREPLRSGESALVVEAFIHP